MTILLLLFAVGAHAESHEELVRRAFNAMEPDLSASWSYTETSRNSEGTYVARFDPRLPEDEHWTLLTVDGRAPTAAELEEFLEEKGRNRREDDDDNGPMFADGSIRLIEETDDYWLFTFRPITDTDDEAMFMAAVDARLKVAKQGHFVSRVSMRNTDTIKPGKGVKIKKFETELEFAPAYKGGPTVPQRVRAAVQGKAFLVVKIDEEEHIEFTEFERIAN
ncbi:MAG: hypothetical protein QNJ14_15945 [Woeseiaceae bacterium]|nr:hypothetical protein [Woeseiaceae bacterium]